MCIIAFNPNATDLPKKEYMDEMWTNNPHGAGFTYNDAAGKVIVVKGLMKKKSLERALEAHRAKWTGHRLVIHWRITTHGPTDARNTHPHVVVPGKLVLIHNGMLAFEDPHDKVSDSAIFARHLARMKDPMAAITDEGLAEILSSAVVGSSNKVVFLGEHGVYRIYNYEAFIKPDDTGWEYSNETFRTCRAYTRVAYSGYDVYDDDSYTQCGWKVTTTPTTAATPAYTATPVAAVTASGEQHRVFGKSYLEMSKDLAHFQNLSATITDSGLEYFQDKYEYILDWCIDGVKLTHTEECIIRELFDNDYIDALMRDTGAVPRVPPPERPLHIRVGGPLTLTEGDLV